MQIRWIFHGQCRPIDPSELAAAAGRADGVLWVHLDHRDQDAMAALTRWVGPRPDDLTDISTRTPYAKLHMYRDHHFSAINGLARGDDGLLHFQPLKVFLTAHSLWTVLGPSTAALSVTQANRELVMVRDLLDRGELVPADPFDIVSALRGAMLRCQEDIVAAGARRVADLESRIMVKDPLAAEAVLKDLFELRHDLQVIRINAAQSYELYDDLLDTMAVDPHVLPIDAGRLRLLRQKYGHLKNSTDLEREYLQEVLDLLQTSVSNELNKFVRKITAFGTIAVSWTVVAGIYGMNFTSMPELGWRYGYPAALGLMIALSVVLWWLFRRQHWL